MDILASTNDWEDFRGDICFSWVQVRAFTHYFVLFSSCQSNLGKISKENEAVPKQNIYFGIERLHKDERISGNLKLIAFLLKPRIKLQEYFSHVDWALTIR
jgi:hypothetical protein